MLSYVDKCCAIQEGEKRAIWEENLPELKLPGKAQHGGNNRPKVMDFDDTKIKLGEKYLTQGAAF